jgi:hypothetical protein
MATVAMHTTKLMIPLSLSYMLDAVSDILSCL